MKKFLAAISILIVLSSCASPSSLVNKVTQKEVEKNVLTNLPGKIKGKWCSLINN